MLQAFLLVFNPADGPRQQILDYLDTRSEIKNWYAFLPSAVFIISNRDAHVLSDIFRARFPKRDFIITVVPRGANNGWLNKEIWDFINNPKSAGRWP